MDIKINVNENVKVMMNVEEEISLVEFYALLDSTSKIIKGFNKDSSVCGIHKSKQTWVKNILTIPERKEVIKIFEKNDVKDRRDIAIKKFPELKDRSYKQLYNMAKNLKKKLKTKGEL